MPPGKRLAIAKVQLGEAFVRVSALTSEGEREARRAGERFGRAFADGADREGSRSNLAEVLARQVEQASERVVRARRAETGAADEVLAADTRLNAERARGAGRTDALVAAENRLDDALRRFARTQGETRDATVRHGQAQSALQSETARTEGFMGRLSGALSRVGRDADDSGNRVRGFGAAGRDADSSSKGFAASLATLGLAAKGLGLILKPNIYAELIPVVLGATAAVAELSGALLILPGVLTTAGLAFGTLKIATSGFGDALKNMGDPAKFAESLKKLTPSAASAAVAIQSLKGRFDQLRNSLQERLFSGLDTEIRATGATMLNVLQPAMERISESANRMIKGLLQDFRSLRGQQVFTEIGAEGSRAFDNITRAVRPLVQAFLDVASVGAKVFADLTGGAGAASQKFADFIARLKESGKLEEIMLRGVEAVKKLGTVVGNVFGIISSVMKASGADGQTFLDKMVQITGKVDEFFKSMQGQFALGVFFDLVAAIQVVVAELAPLGPAVLAVMGSITRALQTAAPFVSPLAESFGNLVIAITPLVDLAGQVAAAILSGLTVVMRDLTPIIGTLVLAIQGFVTNALPGLKDGFTKAWETARPLLGVLAELALTILPPLGTALGAVVSALGPLLGPLIAIAGVSLAWSGTLRLLGPLLGLLGPPIALVTGALKGLTVAWRLLPLAFAVSPFGIVLLALAALAAGLIYAYQNSETFRNIVDGAFRAVGEVISNIVGIVTGHLRALGQFLATDLPNAVRGGIDAVINFFGTNLPNGVRAGIDRAVEIARTGSNNISEGVRAGIDRAVQLATDGSNRISEGVRSGIDRAVQAAQTGSNNISNAVRSGIDQAVQFAQQLPGRLANLGNQMASVGQGIINGIGRGIQAGWSYLINLVQNLAQSLFNAAKSALGIGSPSKLFRDEIGKQLSEGAALGVEARAGAVVDAVRRMAAAATDAGRIDLKTVIPSGLLGSRVSPAFTAAGGMTAPQRRLGNVAELETAAPVVTNYIYNPQAERASDSINRELRKFAALGGFSR